MNERDTQQQQRALLDNIPDMAWLKDRDSRYLAVNTAYMKVLGVASEQALIGKRPAEVWPAEIAAVYVQTDRAVLKSGRRRRYEETRVDSKGVLRWFETIKSPIRDEAGHIIGTVGISRDISARKAAADELIESRAQLRELSNFLQTVREEERARISRELHDELGQTLTAMKMELGWLRDRVPAEPVVLRTRVDRLISIDDRSVTDLQRIAADLRPLILDELGLVSAIQWLAQNVAAQSALAIDVTFDREDASYGGAVSTAAFRIVQESLTNIVRHGHATRASVNARHINGELHLEINDNGRGMDRSTSARRRLGLIGMQERARMLGGSVEIDSEPERGTRVKACLPFASPAERGKEHQ
jgi:PAS domain S-box-containing protein